MQSIPDLRLLRTAGLHFTPELLEEIKAEGVEIAHVTLHVGLGTFRPVKADDILDHHMHSEFYRIEASEAEKINRAKESGHRVICVGTTSCRTVESAADENGKLKECSGWTEISSIRAINSRYWTADHELPFTGVNADHAGKCACRKRACACGI